MSLEDGFVAVEKGAARLLREHELRLGSTLASQGFDRILVIHVFSSNRGQSASFPAASGW